MYYLGVDGGGTKTLAVLTNVNGKLLKKVNIGAGNIAVLGATRTKQLIQNLFGKITGEYDIDKIAWGTFAFAGSGREPEKNFLRKALLQFKIKHFSIMTDAEVLYYSIFEDLPGILLMAGTGSVCLTRIKNQFKQIGGWGYLLGDKGSGYDISRQAIRIALSDSKINNQTSQLTQSLLDFYQVKNATELVGLIYSQSNPQHIIASSAKLICDLAKCNDTEAIEIVNNAAKSLLNLAKTAISEINQRPPYHVALSGSILSESSVVSEAFKSQAQKEKIQFTYHTQNLSPVAAAVMHSLKMKLGSIPGETRRNLEKIML